MRSSPACGLVIPAGQQWVNLLGHLWSVRPNQRQLTVASSPNPVQDLAIYAVEILITLSVCVWCLTPSSSSDVQVGDLSPYFATHTHYKICLGSCLHIAILTPRTSVHMAFGTVLSTLTQHYHAYIQWTLCNFMYHYQYAYGSIHTCACT